MVTERRITLQEDILVRWCIQACAADSVVLTGLAAGDIEPLLHDKAEAPYGGGKVGEVAVGVKRQICLALLLELGEAFLVVAVSQLITNNYVANYFVGKNS